jgi:hypothetical protein
MTVIPFFGWPITIGGPSGFAISNSHLFAVFVSILWVGLQK